MSNEFTLADVLMLLLLTFAVLVLVRIFFGR
jgi:hypothetical protein